MKPRPRILWLDCLGGLIVGIVVVAICQPLSNWECLPVSIMMGMGIANLIYGCFSLFVTLRRPRAKSQELDSNAGGRKYGVVAGLCLNHNDLVGANFLAGVAARAGRRRVRGRSWLHRMDIAGQLFNLAK